MRIKTTFSIFSIILLLVAFCAQAYSQNAIAPQKRALIKELLEVTESVKLAEATSRSMMMQMEQEFPRIMNQLMTQQMAEDKLTPGQREALQNDYNKYSDRMLKAFREKVFGTINYAELLEQISLELYDKYFTEDELKDLLVFYRTPTGKKTIQVMPKLATDSIQKSGEIMMPKIMNALNEVIQEEAKRIK